MVSKSLTHCFRSSPVSHFCLRLDNTSCEVYTARRRPETSCMDQACCIADCVHVLNVRASLTFQIR